MTPLDAWLEEWNERSAVFEYEAGMPRSIAEAWARWQVAEMYGERPGSQQATAAKETR